MTGTAVTNYDALYAEQAKAYVEQEKLSGGTFISTRGGTLSVGDEQMPGNQMAVIVLDAIMENTFYDAKFDPENKQPPLCYAFGRDATEMAPHETMQVDLEYFIPQANTCLECPHNRWGSADKGRGKACQNRRRLALIPAGFYSPRRGSRDFDLELFDDPAHFQTADIAYLKLPVTSVTPWSKFVNQIGANFNRPPHGVVTRIWLEPDPKYQYVMGFEVIEQVPDTLAQAIMARHEQALAQVIQGYQVPEEQPPGHQVNPREQVHQGSLRSLRGRR